MKTKPIYTVPNLEGVSGGKIIDIELTDAYDLNCSGCFTARGKQANIILKGLV